MWFVDKNRLVEWGRQNSQQSKVLKSLTRADVAQSSRTQTLASGTEERYLSTRTGVEVQNINTPLLWKRHPMIYQAVVRQLGIVLDAVFRAER